nr:BAF_HP1_G0055440.mRNA.1.CDS.1 [Saccharomyces cerevisiae]
MEVQSPHRTPTFSGTFLGQTLFFFFFFASHEIGTYLSAEESALDRYLSRFCGERESWDKCKKEMVGTKGQYTGPAVPPVPTTNLNDIGDPTKTRTFLRRIFLYIIQNIFSKLLNLLIDLNRPSGNKTL